MFYGDNTIVDRMARLRSQILSGVKYQDLADNELIKMLIPGLNREGKPKKFETVMKLRDSASKDAYTYAWRDLLEYRNKEVRDLAKDLILYSFYTSGGRGTGVYATLDLVPFEVLGNMSYINNGVDYTYNQYLRDVMQRSRNNALDAEKYLEYAFRALQDSEDIVQSAITSRKSYIVDSQEKDGKIVYFTTEFNTFNTSDGLPSPFLKIGDDLYKYVGMKTNSSESYPVYALTNSINFKERGFSINEGTLTSSFDENQREDTTDLHIPFNEKFIGDAKFTARNAFTQNPTETPVVDYTSLDEGTETSTDKQPIRKTYSGSIASLADNQVFVFGSNTQGKHGKGAALTARNKFGAKYGQAEGPQGQSYAIITKDLTKSKHPSRTVEQIKEQIHNLYEYAKQNPDKEFLVAYSGTGANLNAYSNQEMADMFSSEPIPNNIVFEESFNALITESPESTDLMEVRDELKAQEEPVVETPAAPKENPFNITRIPEDKRQLYAKDTGITIDHIETPTNQDIDNYQFGEVTIVTATGARIQMAPKAGYQDLN